MKEKKQIPLRGMKTGESGIITSVHAKGELGRRIRDLGLVKGTQIRICGRAPLNDPVAVIVKGFTVTLRNSEADFINVEVQRDE